MAWVCVTSLVGSCRNTSLYNCAAVAIAGVAGMTSITISYPVEYIQFLRCMAAVKDNLDIETTCSTDVCMQRYRYAHVQSLNTHTHYWQ